MVPILSNPFNRPLDAHEKAAIFSALCADGEPAQDAQTSPTDHGFFNVGDDWEFSPNFWDNHEQA